MAEELKRHGITFSLDLNKHPKDATNLSLINAENFKISEDGASLVSDKSLLENEIIKNKLNEYYKNIHFDIIHCISTNDEIVLFIASNYIEDSYYDLDLFRYSEKLYTCSDSIIPSEYEKMKYYGGKFSGTFTYNVKNELIITFCEYNSVLQTELECGEPMKIINLGYWEKFENNEYRLINNYNLNPKTFPICPEVVIPQTINSEIIKGYSKKGWYHFYIRYKIDDYNYTQWFDFGESFYLDEFKDQKIFKYLYKELYIDVNNIFSNDTDIVNKAIKFIINNLDNKYKYYQIAYTCSSKTYTDCKITKDINIFNNIFELNNYIYDDYDVSIILQSYINYYNVKNIINYNNRIYISNFKINNKINNEIVKINYKLKRNNLNDGYKKVSIDGGNNYNYIDVNNDIYVKDLYNINYVYLSEGLEFGNREYKSFNNIRISKELYLSLCETYFFNIILSEGLYFDLNNIILFTPKENKKFNITGGDNFSSDIEEFFENNYVIKIIFYYTAYKLKDISNEKFTYNSEYDYIENKNYNNNIVLIGNNNNNLFRAINIQPKYKLINANIQINAINTLIPNQPYLFYIHYIDKYGQVHLGNNIEFGNNIIYRNNNKYVKLENWRAGENGLYKYINLYYKLNEKLFISKNNNLTLSELINLDNCMIIIRTQNPNTQPIFDKDIIKNYLKGAESKLNTDNYYELLNDKTVDYYNLTLGEIITSYNINNIDIPKENWKINFIPKYNDIIPYYNANGDSGLIILYETNDISYILNFYNINIPVNYVSYFISYEKLDKTLIHQGFINYEQNSNDYLAKLYNDNLNYKNNININCKYLNKLFKINEIEKIDYIVANDIKSDNYGKSTHLEFISNNNKFEIGHLYKSILNRNLNKNKVLIRISNIMLEQKVDISTYSFISLHQAIIINNSYRINNTNRLINDNNELLQETPFTKEEFLAYDYINHSSKELNNYPKIYKTIINEVNYDDKDAEFNDSYLFLPVDTIDLFKNNSLDFDESVLYIYTNNSNNTLNLDNFEKTIRRSTYIKDESLENGWRIFESEAYQNIQENKGEITRIEGIGDLLLVHTKDSLFQFNKNNLLVTENKTVQLGQQDTFDVGYKEIFTSPFGYGGLQDKEAAIVGEFGYIWYNNDFNKIYQYDAGSLNVISGNIEFLLNKYKPIKCRFTDDKENTRLLIQFQLNNNSNQILNLTYNYDIKAFISFYIDEDNIINETYNTKTKFYILENNKIFSGFDKSNAKKLSFIINENYTKIKRLNYIKYKLYKRIDTSNGNFDANSPVKGNTLSIVNNRRPYSGYKLKVYNDLCTTDEIDIQVDLKSENNIDIKKPYYDLGNFTFNYLRDKDTDSQIFGNFFIVEFIFDQNDYDIIEFESLEYVIDYEEN